MADIEVLDYPHDVILSKISQRRRYNLLISMGNSNKRLETSWECREICALFKKVTKDILFCDDVVLKDFGEIASTAHDFTPI